MWPIGTIWQLESVFRLPHFLCPFEIYCLLPVWLSFRPKLCMALRSSHGEGGGEGGFSLVACERSAADELEAEGHSNIKALNHLGQIWELENSRGREQKSRSSWQSFRPCTVAKANRSPRNFIPPSGCRIAAGLPKLAHVIKGRVSCTKLCGLWSTAEFCGTSCKSYLHILCHHEARL